VPSTAAHAVAPSLGAGWRAGSVVDGERDALQDGAVDVRAGNGWQIRSAAVGAALEPGQHSPVVRRHLPRPGPHRPREDDRWPGPHDCTHPPRTTTASRPGPYRWPWPRRGTTSVGGCEARSPGPEGPASHVEVVLLARFRDGRILGCGELTYPDRTQPEALDDH
jgi:hypothetical protein